MLCCLHVETCHLICTANQMTGFYIRAILAFNGLNKHFETRIIGGDGFVPNVTPARV